MMESIAPEFEIQAYACTYFFNAKNSCTLSVLLSTGEGVLKIEFCSECVIGHTCQMCHRTYGCARYGIKIQMTLYNLREVFRLKMMVKLA